MEGANHDIIEKYFQLNPGILEDISKDHSKKDLVDIIFKYYNEIDRHEQSLKQVEELQIQKSELNGVLISLETKLNQVTDENDKIQKQLQDSNLNILEKQQIIDSKQIEIDVANKKIISLQQERQASELSTSTLSDQVNELLKSIEFKNNQIISNNNTFNELNEKYQHLLSQNQQLKAQADFKASGYDFDFSANSVKIEGKIKELHNKLISTVEEYTEKLHAKDSELASIQIELKCRDKQNELLLTENKLLKSNLTDNLTKIYDLNKQLCLTESDLKSAISSTDQRINAIQKFYSTQQSNTLEINTKLLEYLQSIELLKNRISLLEKEKSKYKSDIQNIKLQHEENIKNIQNEHNLTIKENDILKNLIQSHKICESEYLKEIMLDPDLLERSSSVAVSSSKLLASNFSLSDIYKNYITEHEQFIKFRDENQIATDHIKKLLYDNDKLKKINDEFSQENNNLINVNNLLSKNLNDARTEIYRCNHNIRELENKNKSLNFEIKKINNVLVDMNAQIQCLLHQVELLQSGNVSSLDMDLPTPLFTSIADLQTVNCRLLEIVHELELEMESFHTSNLSINDIENSKLIDDKIENKNCELRQIKQFLKITTQQRDTYKMLLQQKYGQPNMADSSVSSSNDVDMNSLISHKDNLDLVQMYQKYNKLNQEHNEYKLATTDEIITLKNKLSKETTSVEHLNSKLIQKKQQIDMLKSNLSAVQMKCVRHEEYTQTLNDSIDKLKQNNNTAVQEFDRLKHAHHSLISECDNFKQMLKNLQIENDFYRHQLEQNHPLLVQFQQINQQLHNIDYFSKINAASRIDQIKQDIYSLKSQIDSLQISFQTYQSEVTKHHEIIRQQISHDNLQLQNTLHKLKQAETKLNSLQSTGSLMTDISFENNADSNLQHQYNELKVQVEVFRSLSDATEHKLVEISKEYQQLQQTLEMERKNHLENEKLLMEKNSELELQINSNISESMEVKRLNEMITQLQNNLNSLTTDYQNISKIYQSEVIGHSNAIKELTDFKSKSVSDDDFKINLQSQIDQLKIQLHDSDKQIVQKDAQIQEFKNKFIELQNINMHQTTAFSEQIVKLKDRLGLLSSDITNTSIDSSTLNDTSLDDLCKILDYTRRQNSILLSQLKYAQEENTRFSIKCSNLNDTIHSLENSLNSERELKHSVFASIDELKRYNDALELKKEFEIKNNNLSTQLTRSYENNDKLSRELSQINTRSQILCDKNASLLTQVDDLLAQNSILTAEVDKLKREVQILQISAKKNSAQQNVSKKLSSLVEEHKECKSKLENFAAKENNYSNQIKRLTEENISLKSRLSETQPVCTSRLNDAVPSNTINVQDDAVETRKAIPQIILPPEETAVSRLQITPIVARQPVANSSNIRYKPKPKPILAPGVTAPNDPPTDIVETVPTSETPTQVPDSSLQIILSELSTCDSSNQTSKSLFSSFESKPSTRFGLSRNLIKTTDLATSKSNITEATNSYNQKTNISESNTMDSQKSSSQYKLRKRPISTLPVEGSESVSNDGSYKDIEKVPKTCEISSTEASDTLCSLPPLFSSCESIADQSIGKNLDHISCETECSDPPAPPENKSSENQPHKFIDF